MESLTFPREDKGLSVPSSASVTEGHGVAGAPAQESSACAVGAHAQQDIWFAKKKDDV